MTTVLIVILVSAQETIVLPNGDDHIEKGHMIIARYATITTIIMVVVELVLVLVFLIFLKCSTPRDPHSIVHI